MFVCTQASSQNSRPCTEVRIRVRTDSVRSTATSQMPLPFKQDHRRALRLSAHPSPFVGTTARMPVSFLPVPAFWIDWHSETFEPLNMKGRGGFGRIPPESMFPAFRGTTLVPCLVNPNYMRTSSMVGVVGSTCYIPRTGKVRVYQGKNDLWCTWGRGEICRSGAWGDRREGDRARPVRNGGHAGDRCNWGVYAFGQLRSTSKLVSAFIDNALFFPCSVNLVNPSTGEGFMIGAWYRLTKG